MQRKSGPRTARGRAAVRHNALTHGLRTADILMPGELPADWHNFHDRVVGELAPDSPILCELASEIATILWRLRRVPRAEAELVRPGDIPRPGELGEVALGDSRELAAMFSRRPEEIDVDSPSVIDAMDMESEPVSPPPVRSVEFSATPPPTPGSDPLARLMTPLPQQTPLERIVRYQAHLTGSSTRRSPTTTATVARTLPPSRWTL